MPTRNFDWGLSRSALSRAVGLACLATSTLATGCGGGGGDGPPDSGMGGDAASGPGNHITPCGPEETCIDGQPSPFARGDFEDPGVITGLDVAPPDGADKTRYAVGDPLVVDVRVEPNEGWESRLESLTNTHVGLVEVVDPEAEDLDQARADARTCYLGQLGEPVELLDDGSYRFSQRFILPHTCIEELESAFFNIWVALNPARELPGEDIDIDPEFFNTQFFNELYEDTDGEDRNRQCEDSEGNTGCIHRIELVQSPGLNVVMQEPELDSNVFVFDPSRCVEGETQYDNPLFRAVSNMDAFGARAFDSEGVAQNALAAAGIERVHITFEMCARADDGSCTDDYVTMPAAAVEASGERTLVNRVPVNEMVVGSTKVVPHQLHIPRGSMLCDRLAGLDTPDWSDYRLFNLRVCSDAGGDEANVDGTAAEDNCRVIPVRMVHEADTPDGRSMSALAFERRWQEEIGGDVVELSADVATINRIDLSGAYSQNWARFGLDGWLQSELLDITVEAGAYVSGVGSGLHAHLDVADYRILEADETIDETVRGIEQMASKEDCGGFALGVAGIVIKGEVCFVASAGMTSEVRLEAREASGDPPFDEATRIGVVAADFERRGHVDYDAEAYVDGGVGRAGVRGELLLADANANGLAELKWGLISGPALVATWSVTAGLDVELMDGYLDVFADVAKPAWCSCGKFCGYPCRKWKNVATHRIADYDGLSLDMTLLERENPYGVTLVE